MATLDNENLSTDDQVYDVVHGYGTVISTSFNAIHVRFPNGTRFTYGADGSYGGVRRLYWHDPVIIPPPKNNRLWDALVRIAEVAHEQLKRG